MDDHQFDDLTRSLTAAASRRSVLAGLVSGMLAAVPFGFGGEDAKAKKKRKKKKKKKTPTAAPCTPTCAPSNSCGDDGCGGSCGACSGGASCQGVTCVCPPGQDFCGGLCHAACPISGRVRDPLTCGCCRPSGVLELACLSATLDPCCSGLTCQALPEKTACPGRAVNDACSFGAQCASGYCNPNLVCA